MGVGERIKEFRKKKGLTQAELGALLGVSQQMIGQFENSLTPPKIETLQKIASALNVPVTQLIPLSPSTEQPDEIPLTCPMSSEALKKLTLYFNKLNDTGKEKALERIEELTEIAKYTE